MPAGRPPKPTALKVLHGNPGNRPLNANEPTLPVGRPERPKFLRSKAARRHFEKQVAELLGMNVCTLRDGIIIGMLAHYLAWYEFAAEDLNSRGPVLTGIRFSKMGDPIEFEYVSPYWNILEECAHLIDKFGSQLGYSPVTRAKLKAGIGPEKKDEMEDLINRTQETTSPLLVPDIDESAPDESTTATSPKEEA